MFSPASSKLTFTETSFFYRTDNCLKYLMRVASVVFNYFTNDSRVEKQAMSLGLLGLEVSVFALWKKMDYHLNNLIKIT